MKKSSLPIKIGTLMAVAIFLISATGYLSYRSLSSIVASIQVRSKTDDRLLTIREISADLERAENSIRIFTYTRNQKDIDPYYSTIVDFDERIDRLRLASSNDSALLVQIDTISSLIEEEIVIWNRMLYQYSSDSLDRHIRKLTARLSVDMLRNKNAEKSILRRVFSRKNQNQLKQEEIIRDLHNIEKHDSLQARQMLAAESQLAQTGGEIRERFYYLIAQMEKDVISSVSSNARAADKLARKTYLWLTMFVFTNTLLAIMVLVIVVRFVRKSRDYQLALIRSKEATENLTRTRELFMANMSHEIRTPVTAISGFTEQLQYKPFDEKSRKILEIIKSSSDHLVRIVNNILDLSRLHSSKIILEKTHFQIHAICEEMQLLFEKKARENNTSLTFSISDTTPLVLLGDPYRLKQILINLVGNAVKFTSDGLIHLSVDGSRKTEDSFDLMLKVSDTGIGISREMQERIFDEFAQADPDTSRKYGGTGLGLSIVKKLTELHLGTISLESQKNSGTTVTCQLPYNTGNWELLPSVKKGLQVPGWLKSLRFLIVDDEAYNRMLFRTIFERWNVPCDEAADGFTAFELVKTNGYDLIFMDVRMPVMDGLKTTALIRNELGKSESALPVIGISASHTDEDLMEFNGSGMNTYLPKPFTENALLEVILSVLDPEDRRLHGHLHQESIISSPLNGKVNLDNLYHLADHDIPFVRQMLKEFIHGTGHGLQEICQAVETSNYNVAGETAHKLSAPCKHIGAEKLYTLLKSIENEARTQKNRITLVRFCEDSMKEYSEIKDILQQHIMKISES